MRGVTCSIGLAGALASPLPAIAQAGGGQNAEPTAEQLVRITSAADVQTVGPGQKFHLAFIFDIEPGWHISWKNPGEGAPSPVITINAPAGFEIGDTLWPRPTPAHDEVGELYVFETQTVLFVPVTAPAELSAADARFDASIRWAVCKQICLMGSAKRSITLPVSQSAGEPSSNKTIATYFSRLPKPLREQSGAHIDFHDGTLTITGRAEGKTAAKFFGLPVPGVTFGAASTNIEKDQFRIVVPVEIDPNNSLGQAMSLGGVVALGGDLSDPCYDFSIPVPQPSPVKDH